MYYSSESDLTGSPKEQYSSKKDAVTITVDTSHEDSLMPQSSSRWDRDYNRDYDKNYSGAQWALPSPLPDPCHPWSKALKQDVPHVPSPVTSDLLNNLFGPARRKSTGSA